jgi:Serine incorporator (Serinc)
VLGLFVCILGLGYTGWSCTAEDNLSSSSKSTSEATQSAAAAADANANANASASATTPYQAATDSQGEGKKVTGVVVSASADEEAGAAHQGGNNGHGDDGDGDDDDESHPQGSDPGTLSNSWRLNAILAFICCWTAVVLTEWGSVKGSGDVANPQTGNVAMWMVAASQWIVLLLYTWTLVAPRLLPNRDFS